MSIYSGKCDFKDTIEIYGEDKILNNYKTYLRLNKKNVLLDFKAGKDMMPFYPHIVGSMASSDGHGTIYLSQYPYPYEEEQKYWNMTVSRFRRKLSYERNKSKKTGEPFNLTDFTAQFIREWTVFRDNDEQLWDVCNQILSGKKKLKYPLRNGARWYMTALCNDLAMAGIDPTTFGYIIKDGKVVDYDKTAVSRYIRKEK